MDIYNNNVAALKKNMPEMYDAMHEELESGSYDESICEFCSARNGSSYMQYTRDGKVIRLNSNYNPEGEASKWAEQIEGKSIQSVIVMFGIGTGAFVRALLDRIGSEDIIVMYEPDVNVFLKIMHETDISDILKNKHTILVSGKELYKTLYGYITALVPWANLDALQVMRHPGYEDFLSDRYDEFCDIINNIRNAISSAGETAEYFGIDVVYNSINNLKYLKDSYYLVEYIDAFPEKTAGIVVAAGPSLDKNIQLLHEVKEKAVIIAADTALKRLKKEGIVPDFTITVDPRKPIEYFDDTDFENIPLFCKLDSNYRVIEKHKGRKIWCNPSLFLIDIFKYAGISYIEGSTGGSVATAAFSTLFNIGIKTIILIGQDLAYAADGNTHAGSVTDTREATETFRTYVKGNIEPEVRTRSDWYIFLKWYERKIKFEMQDIKIINATEGGAYIEGTEVMTLREAIDKYCTGNIGVTEIINSVDNDKTEVNKRIEEFLKNCIRDLGLMRKNFEKGKTLCNRCERKYSKAGKMTVEVSDCMNDINKINSRVDAMPVYKLIDSIIIHRDSKAIKSIYSKEEDNEYDNNINMLKSTRHIYDMGLEAIDEIYDVFKEAVGRADNGQ